MNILTHKRLAVYQAEMHTELVRILNFWIQHGVDWKNGGFIAQRKADGQWVKGAPKGGVLNARILWTFSAAFRHSKRDEYRIMADRAYAYFSAYFLDQTHGGVYWSVESNGAPLSTRKQIYGLAFALYGLSEYYLATNHPQALTESIALFDWIERHAFDAQRGGYYEAFSREGALLNNLRLSEKDRNDPKTLNTHLHLLEAYTNLYRVWPDAHLATQLHGLIETILRHFINSESQHLCLFFTETWNCTADITSFGHDIEASWLLLEASLVLDPDPLNELTQRVRKAAVQLAYAASTALQPDGSLHHEVNWENGQLDTHREWWVSAEAMVGFLAAYQQTGYSPFLDSSLGAWEFAKAHLLDYGQGEWIWGVFDDYRPMDSEDKIGFWKCPYHNARACMEVAKRCQLLTTGVHPFNPVLNS